MMKSIIKNLVLCTILGGASWILQQSAYAQLGCLPLMQDDANTITKHATCEGPGIWYPGEYRYNIRFRGYIQDPNCVVDITDNLPPSITNVNFDPLPNNYIHPTAERIGQGPNAGSACRDATITGTFDTPGVHTNNVDFDLYHIGLGTCGGARKGSDSVTCTIIDPSTFVVEKSAEFNGLGFTGALGDPVTFTIDAERSWYAHELEITDAIPSNFVIGGVSATVGTVTINPGNLVVWTHPGDNFTFKSKHSKKDVSAIVFPFGIFTIDIRAMSQRGFSSRNYFIDINHETILIKE